MKESIKIKLDTEIALLKSRLHTEISMIPHYVDIAKKERDSKKEEKNAIKRMEKAAEKAYKEENTDDLSEQIKQDIYDLSGHDTMGTFALIEKALAAKKLIQYTYFYMTDEKAKLIKKNQIEREVINGIAAIFDFGSIYDSAGAADLRKYDFSYKEKFNRNGKYLFCIADLVMKTKDNTFMKKLHSRQKQLFGEEYLAERIKAREKVEEEKKRKQEEYQRQEEIAKREEAEKKIKKAGEKGEMDVEYNLNFLPPEYRVIEKEKNKKIYLKCQSVSEESQEIDHIVISPQGVFVIETKNFSGKIVIDEQGNWIRHKRDGSVIGEENPKQQVYRHHRIVEGILGDVDIQDIICIANEKAILEGVSNCKNIPVIKSDSLLEYLLHYQNASGKVYSDEEMQDIVMKIEAHRIKN